MDGEILELFNRKRKHFLFQRLIAVIFWKLIISLWLTSTERTVESLKLLQISICWRCRWVFLKFSHRTKDLVVLKNSELNFSNGLWDLKSEKGLKVGKNLNSNWVKTPNALKLPMSRKFRAEDLKVSLRYEFKVSLGWKSR